MTDLPGTTRARFLAAGAAAAAGVVLERAPAHAAYPPPEKPALKVGVAVAGMSFLPAYVAYAKTWKAQGLDVELITFRGDAEIAQALVGNSIDVSYQSPNGFINMISAQQPVIGFYAGFRQADFAWLAQSDVKRWADLKGKTIGVSTYGSLTDALTRYALRRNKLDPDKDVQIVQAGGTPSAYQALRSGKLAASILSPPFTWNGVDEGLTLLGTQVKEVSPQWPKHLIGAQTSFIAANPHTVQALLRGHVGAIRLARTDRDATIGVIQDALKLTRPDAERAVALEVPFYDERGNLPDPAMMSVFWQITQSLGDVQSPWPNDKLLDRRFVNSFASWAP